MKTEGRDDALIKAIIIVSGNATGQGGTGKLAKRLAKYGAPIRPHAISRWRRVPPTRVLAVERASGVSRYELRPDIYGEI